MCEISIKQYKMLLNNVNVLINNPNINLCKFNDINLDVNTVPNFNMDKFIKDIEEKIKK
jgi:hypothetical protein